MGKIDRRSFLLGGTVAAGAVTAGAVALPLASTGGARGSSTTTGKGVAAPGAAAAVTVALTRDPFTLGVASGDPGADGFVLWTRLAPLPLNPDGKGGMPSSNVDVEWQVATDGDFANVVASGTTIATPAAGHSVHVEVTGLEHSRFYFYRFRALTSPTHISPRGRTRTAPGPGVTPNSLRMGIASCAHLERAWYHAYRQMASDNLDLILFLGDYVYENGAHEPDRPNVPKPDNVRQYVRFGDEADTLAEYRVKYAQHRLDSALRDAHASAPWVVVFDDHEVRNNFNISTPAAAQKAQAFQAWYEHMPVRAAQRPNGGAMTLYRRFGWGTLARFHMLDTRQGRSVQDPSNNENTSCSIINDPARRMISAEQERWLLDGLAEHPWTWDFLGQQVFFANRDRDRNPSTCEGSRDSWNGYRPQHDRIAAGWAARGVPNPVMLTGDVHRHWAADLLANPYDQGSAHIGVELVTTSVSSGGVRAEPGEPDILEPLPDMPYIKYRRDRRGYVRCTVTASELTAEFMTVSNPVEQDFGRVSVTADRRFIVPAGARRLVNP